MVKQETKMKVIAAAKELNYVPNLLGKQLKSGQTNMLGFFTNSVSGPYFYTLIESIARTADSLGYGLNVFVTKRHDTIQNYLFGNVVDGVIVFESRITENDAKMIEHHRIPAVFLDRPKTGDKISSITFNSYKEAFDATAYLISLGRRKIVYLAGYPDNFDSNERQRGYEDALQKYGIPVNRSLILPGLFEEPTSYSEMRRFINLHPEDVVDGILAGNDISAIGAMRALKENGINVPQDVSVIGFDDVEIARYFQPSLTTTRNPIGRQGVITVKQLVSMIAEDAKGQMVVLDGQMIVRDSTAIKQ
ncbi:hypothetical protein L248_3080 [Schleiferilactobacillus shenzhenensis LY-73]|uniref:HTH lacI-type domain-containing protein n=1 Tax=Schleiferilactobacillus shenzhenensis LY-73 TaxID=1231336 RepID=U4TUN7_9LACO|nr:hypothetical protein L248_3080 [Schleiferilactobacillus shenzhenensis LY-73]